MEKMVWKYSDSVVYHVEADNHHVVITDPWRCSCGGNEIRPCRHIAAVALAVLTDEVEDRGPEPCRI
jgi:uncharacterized Zn finger protein